MTAQIILTLWDCKTPVPEILCQLQAMSTGSLGTLQDEQARLKAEYDRMEVQSHFPHFLTFATHGPASASSCRAALRMRSMDVQSHFPHSLTFATDGPPSAFALSSSPVHVPPQALPQLLTIVKRWSSQACE